MKKRKYLKIIFSMLAFAFLCGGFSIQAQAKKERDGHPWQFG